MITIAGGRLDCINDGTFYIGMFIYIQMMYWFPVWAFQLTYIPVFNSCLRRYSFYWTADIPLWYPYYATQILLNIISSMIYISWY